jgi:hypothetical protein
MTEFEQQAKRAGKIHLNAKIDALAEMLIEIEEEGYIIVPQVVGALINRIEMLTEIKEQDDAKDSTVTRTV